jgi:hypothetical protein
MSQDGAAELYLSNDADIEVIASAMITLGATLQDALDAVASDESVPVPLRMVAVEVRSVVPALSMYHATK